MATRKQKAKVGFFLVICGVIIAVGIIVLSGYQQEPRVHYWIEFDESVLGLGKDSIVEYQGVPVGKVENIYVTETNKAHVDFFVFTQKVTLRTDVKGQLVLYSLATGTLSVSLSGGEGDPLPPGVEITATKSLVKAVSSSIEDILTKVDTITKDIQRAMQGMGEGDLTAMVGEGRKFMENANKVIVDLKAKAEDGIDQFKEIAQHIDSLVTDTNATVNSVKKKVDAFALNQTQDNLNKVMENVADLSKQLKQTADSIDKLSKTALRETGNLEFGLRETLRTLNESLGSARDFLNYLQQDPASLLRGKGKPQGEK